MKFIYLIYLAVSLVVCGGCSPSKPITVTNSQGTFTLIRPEGERQADGSYEVELWAKKGTPTNKTVYIRTMGGLFTGTLP